MDITYDSIAKLYADHGYKFYDKGIYNVNIFGIRKDLTVDFFNDLIGIAYRDSKNNPNVNVYAGTTDPGLYWLKNKLGNINGTFILQPGYYPKCWKLGFHKGEYEALVQAKEGLFKGWRDNDSDGELDMTGPIYTDVHGLNLHTTSHLTKTKAKVGAYSAACQVIQNTEDYGKLIDICKKSKVLYGDEFSYALFQQKVN